IVALKIIGKPYKTTYIESQNFDPSGLQVIAQFNNNTSEEVSDYQLIGYDKSAGVKSLKVEYLGFEDYFNVEVKEKELIDVVVLERPFKVVYQEKEALDLTGLVVYAYYNNGVNEILKNYSVSNFVAEPGQWPIKISYLNKSDSFNVVVENRKLLQISIVNPVLKTVYLENEELSLNGLEVKAYYSNSDEELITNYQVRGFEGGLGLKKIIVEYLGKITSFEVRILAKEITNFEVAQLPNKTVYLESEDFDRKGMIVIAHYNNNTQEEINDYEVLGFDNSVGYKDVMISYGDFSKLITVEIKAKTAKSIKVTTKPVKLLYLEKEQLDPNGLVVSAYYDNNTVDVIEDYQLDYNSLKVGSNRISVKYQDLKTYFIIKVLSKQLVNLELTRAPKKLIYQQGEELDLTGLVVTAYYNNATSDKVLDYSVVGFSSSVGIKNISIFYGNKSVSFKLEVRASKLVSVDVARLNNRELVEGHIFNPDDYQLVAYYDNNTSLVINYPNYEILNYQSLVGPQTIRFKYQDIVAELSLVFLSKKLKAIKLISLPSKLVYIEGQEFNPLGLLVEAYYNNNTSAKIVNYSLSGYDASVGVKEVQVNYHSKKTIFRVEVLAKSLIRLNAELINSNLQLLEKQELTKQHLLVSAYYDNGKSHVINDYKISGYDSSVGEKMVYISYQDKSTALSVRVLQKTLTKIQLAKLPKKLEYLEGEAFSDKGLKVVGIYNNGESLVQSDYTLTGYINTPGEKEIVVSVANYATSFKINVKARKIIELELLHLPNKVEYLEGEALDLSGLKLVAHYDNHTSSNVDVYQLSGFDSKVGVKKINISYLNKVVNFTIQVKAKELESIKVSKLPDKLSYFEDEKLDLTGMEVIAYYSNNTSEIINSYKVSDFTNNQGLNKLTVNFLNKTTILEVNVLAKVVESLYVKTHKSPLYVFANEPFNPNWIEVIAYYNDNSVVSVKDYHVTSFNSKVGKQKIEVEYQSVEAYCEVDVVKRNIVGFSIAKLPERIIYAENEAFSNKGMVIHLHYADGQVEEVKDYSVSGYNSNPGKKIITIDYTVYVDKEGNVINNKYGAVLTQEFSENFEVSVIAKTPRNKNG
ncbi:MAG: bacterial Ig-like domain-containing protein, partial [Erysipelotrichaceae bacterium]